MKRLTIGLVGLLSSMMALSESVSEGVDELREKALAGEANAQCELGFCYSKGQGVEKSEGEAVKWYRKAAEQGHAKAQYNLGGCYEYGKGVEKSYEEAVKWCRKAAEQGHAMAQCKLGFCYERGIGVEKSEEEAVKWFRKSAEQGYDLGQYNLGVCYDHGIGVEKSYEEAVKWFRKSAEQGYATAQQYLGIYYEKGIGVCQDADIAMFWYQSAKKAGYLDPAEKKRKEKGYTNRFDSFCGIKFGDPIGKGLFGNERTSDGTLQFRTIKLARPVRGCEEAVVYAGVGSGRICMVRLNKKVSDEFDAAAERKAFAKMFYERYGVMTEGDDDIFSGNYFKEKEHICQLENGNIKILERPIAGVVCIIATHDEMWNLAVEEAKSESDIDLL